MYNTAETPRGGLRKKSLLSTLKKSNSARDLMALNIDEDPEESTGSDDPDVIFFQEAQREARERRQRNSAAPRLTRSSSTGDLNDFDDHSFGSDDDLVFFKQAYEEETAEEREARRQDRRSLLSAMGKSNSTGKLMDGVMDVKAELIQGTKALAAIGKSSSAGKLMDGVIDVGAETADRGRQKMKNLVQTIRRSTSRNRLDDDSAGSDGERSVTLEDIERITSNTPRSENRKIGLRARLRARENAEAGDLGASSNHSSRRNLRLSSMSPSRLGDDLGASSQHSTRSKRNLRLSSKSPSRMSDTDLGASSQHSTRSKRSSRISSKSPSRMSDSFSRIDATGSVTSNIRRERKTKSLSLPIEDSDNSSLDQKRERRVANRARTKAEKETQDSSDDDSEVMMSSFDQLIQEKERQEAMTSPRSRKKKSKSLADLDLSSSVQNKKSKKPGRSKSSNDSIMQDDSTISTKASTVDASTDQGYDSDGGIGRKKKMTKMVRKASPHEMKRRSIMDELDELEDREVMTLSRQVEELKQQVQSLTSENETIQKQLNKEIDENGKMALKLQEHETGLAKLEREQQTKEIIENMKEEYERDMREMQILLKDRDSNIVRLEQKIDSIRIANDTMQKQRETSRRCLPVTLSDDIEGLQRKVDAQSKELDDLTVKLFVVTEQRDKNKRVIKEVRAEVQQIKDEKKKMEAEFQAAGKENDKAMKRKDETIQFLQESLAKLKLKESKKRDKGRGGSSAFSLTSKRKSTGKRGSLEGTPTRNLSIKGYLGDDSSLSTRKSTSNLALPL